MIYFVVVIDLSSWYYFHSEAKKMEVSMIQTRACVGQRHSTTTGNLFLHHQDRLPRNWIKIGSATPRRVCLQNHSLIYQRMIFHFL